jgi:hypothetical protein
MVTVVEIDEQLASSAKHPTSTFTTVFVDKNGVPMLQVLPDVIFN